MSTEARALMEIGIAHAQARLETITKDLAATKRRRARLLAQRAAKLAEIEGLTQALDNLGGPLPKEDE
jgi:hypothetical protein